MQLELTKLKQAMMAQVDRNNMASNNLANLGTTGFKKDELFFQTLDDKMDISRSMTHGTDFKQGDLSETGNPLDIALSGKGFFTIERGNEQVYTRNGSFKIDNDGVIRTRSGLPVMGEGGWINVFSDSGQPKSIKITEKGEVFADDVYIDKLDISNFEDPEKLTKVGGNMFTADRDALLYQVEEPIVKQGFLESSNVNAAQEMIDLVDLQRQFESMQKVIRSIDDSYRSAVNKVGIYR